MAAHASGNKKNNEKTKTTLAKMLEIHTQTHTHTGRTRQQRRHMLTTLPVMTPPPACTPPALTWYGSYKNSNKKSNNNNNSMKTNRIKLSTLSFALPYPLLPHSALSLSPSFCISPGDYARTSSSVARSAVSRQIWLLQSRLRDPTESIALSGFFIYSNLLIN